VVEHAFCGSGSIRPKTPGHVANTIDFYLIGGIDKAIEDPDYNIFRKYVPCGCKSGLSPAEAADSSSFREEDELGQARR
jgi:hypothetical protein